MWWALKTLHDKGLLYQGHKILPYCPRCGTSLSSHEVAQGYEDAEDPSVYLALDLESAPGSVSSGRRRIVVWTTTPWTLVSNAALAVNPDLTYIEVRKNGRTDWTLLLAESRAIAVLGQEWRSKWEIVAKFTGSELAGLRYKRPLDWVPYAEGAHEIIVAEDFVSADDGSGVVHMSPAFGADDYMAGKKHGLAFLQPVNARGEFPADVPVVGGMGVKAADAADHRGAQEARRALEGGNGAPSVSALLALRHAAAVLRALLVVRAHDGVQGRDDRAQRRDQLDSARDGRGPVRQVAREQHRLGHLARPLLGHAAAGVGERRRSE